MGKKKKEHRKRVAKRNEAIKAQQKRVAKVQEEFFKALIEKERQAGKFENNPVPPELDINLGEGLRI